jgi:hypothetical protein
MCALSSLPQHKVTHIKLGTCSGSSQCQLYFSIKMVSTKEMAVSGCLLYAKILHKFQAFPPLTPSAKVAHFS